MNPHLQVMTGPMLRYDTVVEGIWHGFSLIVTVDSGSNYEPAPKLTYVYGGQGQLSGQDVEAPSDDASSKATVKESPAERIFQYDGPQGSHSFWRFKFEIDLHQHEMPVTYTVNQGKNLKFYVPGKDQPFHWMGHSCNGFSAGVDTDQFNGADPLWEDVLKKHEEKPIHAMIGGGDQIYCDALSKEPEMAEWITSSEVEWKQKVELSDEMSTALDRFFFNHYCSWFRSGAFGRANSTIPMVNMLDDHDLIDGFGSYPDELQKSPVFSAIGSRGYFWYQLFQMFLNTDHDGVNNAGDGGTHPNKSIVFGAKGAFVPYPSQNFLVYLGPKVYILLVDTRAERKKYQVCSSQTYDILFEKLQALPDTVSHVIMLLGVPVAYPRMTIVEKILESKFNPLTKFAQWGLFGLGGFVNKFNAEAELLDDLNDHWTAKLHKKERNALIRRTAQFAEKKRVRVTYLSGDVHAGAVGRFKSLKKRKPENDPRYILNIISSAIVNTSPPPPVIKLVGKLGSHKHRTLHVHGIDEDMVPWCQEDTDGSPPPAKTVLGRRNYVIVDHLQEKNELRWDMRVEISQGEGTTKGYPTIAPAPNYK